jgi:DNA-binding response OmpR family regulator
VSRQIMVCGNDAGLLETRLLVLEQAGFAVVSACSRDGIHSLALNPAIELGVLGHSLSEQEKMSIAQDLRAKWPSAKVLYLTEHRASLEKIADNEYRSDSLEPSQFVADCREILGA